MFSFNDDIYFLAMTRCRRLFIGVRYYCTINVLSNILHISTIVFHNLGYRSPNCPNKRYICVPSLDFGVLSCGICHQSINTPRPRGKCRILSRSCERCEHSPSNLGRIPCSKSSNNVPCEPLLFDTNSN